MKKLLALFLSCLLLATTGLTLAAGAQDITQYYEALLGSGLGTDFEDIDSFLNSDDIQDLVELQEKLAQDKQNSKTEADDADVPETAAGEEAHTETDDGQNDIMPITQVEETVTWSLTTSEGKTINQDTYKDKTVLMVFTTEGDGVLVQDLANSVWTDKVAVVVVVGESTVEGAKTFKEQFAPDSNFDVCFETSYNLMWSIWDDGFGEDLYCFAAILGNGSKLLDKWGSCSKAEDCKQHLHAKGIDLSTTVSSGLGVQYHSAADIQAYVNSHPVPSHLFTYVAGEEPSLNKPYKAGVLDDTTLTSALSMLNRMRYIAGINADVTLDEEMNEKASAGSLVNALIEELPKHEPLPTHFPDPPAGMMTADDPLFILGYDGASHSNLLSYSLQYDLAHQGIQWWMDDTGKEEVGFLGHRRWFINPAMGKTGFGVTTSKKGTSFGAAYAVDASGSGRQSLVAWPAQEMPVQHFSNADVAWSLSVGTEINASDVGVTLVRRSDNRTWKFGKDGNTGGDGASFSVHNGYGQPGCIIFRPGDLKAINAGDYFDVTVNINDDTVDRTIQYTVHFFDLNVPQQEAAPPTNTPTPSDAPNPTPSGPPSDGTPTPAPTKEPSKTPDPLLPLLNVNLSLSQNASVQTNQNTLKSSIVATLRNKAATDTKVAEALNTAKSLTATITVAEKDAANVANSAQFTTIVNNALTNPSAITYLDINIHVSVTGQDGTQTADIPITDTASQISFTYLLPANGKSDVLVLNDHGGKVDIVNSYAVGDIVYFSTAKFCDFGLARGDGDPGSGPEDEWPGFNPGIPAVPGWPGFPGSVVPAATPTPAASAGTGAGGTTATQQPSYNGSIPQTADDTPIGAIALVMLVSVAGLATALIVRKKRNRE